MDASGASYGLHDVEAFGSNSTAIEQGSLDFRLSGQLALPGTEALAFDPANGCPSGACSILAARGRVVTNWHRDYDSDTGLFLEQDPLLTGGSTTPEPYVYGAQRPTTMIDPDGLWRFDHTYCKKGEEGPDEQAMNQWILKAIMGIARCSADCPRWLPALDKASNPYFSIVFKALWIGAVVDAKYACLALAPPDSHPCATRLGMYSAYHELFWQDPPALCPGCAEAIIAHEALHGPPFWRTHALDSPGHVDQSTDPMYVFVRDCFPCAQ